MMIKENNLRVFLLLTINLIVCIDMIFSEDAILLSLLEHYDDERDIMDAVVQYCSRNNAGKP